MTREEAYEKINKVFQEVFDDDSIKVNDVTTSADIEGWDSLEYINLIVSIEETFDIKFNMGEVNSFDNVGQMVDNILSKL